MMGANHLIAQQPTPPAESTADAWVKYGIVNGVKGDLPAAMKAFDEAIKIDPKYAPAYQARGHAWSLQDKLDEAIADDDQAIALDPKLPDAYYDRGVAKARKGDFDNALADLDKAIELKPQYASAYYNRGHIKYFKGDLTGAISDLNRATELDPNSPFSYFMRGLARLAKSDRASASTDFQQSATNGYADAALWVWIVKMKQGDQGEARSELANFMSKPQLFKPDEWPMAVGNFLLEKTSQDDLIAKAKQGTPDPERLCEAWFYSGIFKRFSGDPKGALVCFQQAVANKLPVSEIYIEAQREAADLQTP